MQHHAAVHTPCYTRCRHPWYAMPRPRPSCTQEQRAAKAETHKLQTALMEKDAALQRKDVQVGLHLENPEACGAPCRSK